MSATPTASTSSTLAARIAATAAKPCAGGCGLGREPGDIFCQGCREGHEANRPLDRYPDW